MKQASSFSRGLILISISLLLSILPAQVSGTTACSPAQTSFWQICGPIQSQSLTNLSPSAVQANDGTIQLAWTNVAKNGASLIYYSYRLTNGTWLGCNCSITNLGGHNQNPSIVQAGNGTIFVFWSYKPTFSNHYQLYYRYLKGSAWSNYRPVPLRLPTNYTTTLFYNDTMPATTVGQDGTIWLVWTRDNSTAAGTTTMRQLWYETLNSTGWSVNEQNITRSNDTNWNFHPSVTVGKDGVVRVAYSSGARSSGVYQTKYVYRIGTGWSNPISVSNSSPGADDENPSLVQDRNGTFWIFWARNTPTNFVVMGISSVNNGATWAAETQITAACSLCVESRDPAAVQSITDKSLWIFYSTNPGNGGFSIWTLKSNPISPIHNVDVKSITCALCSLQFSGGLAAIGQSANITITVTVSNPGDFNEPITLTLTATNKTNYALGTIITTINSASTTVLVFNWNTTNVKPARYGLTAALSPISGESSANQVDNTLSLANQVHILPLGDVDLDGSVTIIDISVFFYDYNGVKGVAGSRYNPYCDLVNTGIINIVDVSIALANYNTFT